MEHSYDYWLVGLSFFLAIIASFAALGLVSRIPHISREKSFIWLSGGAVAMGLGIWSMHFVGMLAFHLPVELAYDTTITLISLIIAILSSWAALFIVRNGITNKTGLLSSAALMGTGISGMHYTGMSALQMQPPIEYNILLVALSVLIAILASLYALNYSFNETARTPVIFTARSLNSALIMGVAIAGMHYTGMFAAEFQEGSICYAAPKGVDSRTLAYIIAATTVITVTITVILLYFEISMAEQNAIMVKELQVHNVTLQKKAEDLAWSMTRQLRESAARDRLFATIVEQINEAVITVDLHQTIQSWNKAAEQMFGYTQDEVSGKPVSVLDYSAADELCLSDVDINSSSDFLHRKTKDGKGIYVNIHSSPLLDEENNIIGNILMMRDVTEAREYHQQVMLWSSVYKNSSEGIMITSKSNRIISINKAFTEITGYTEEDVLGRNPKVISSGLQDRNYYETMWYDIKTAGIWKGEIWNKRKNGEIFPEWLTITTLKNPNGEICNHIGIFTDATIYKEKEDHIHYLAYHDKLTGLPNRSLMEDRIHQELIHAGRTNAKIGILFIDLDRFKTINDTLGHLAGDLLLQATAKKLEAVVRSDDTICRQGGDEFIIMIRDVIGENTLAHIAEKIIDAVSEEVEILQEQVSISPSIGIAVYPADGTTFEELIKNADTAMYHAKAQGRANFQFYTSEINQSIQEKMHIEKELVNSIHRKQLSIVLQPQFSLADKQIIGAEILVRWIHPELGEISPADFIPIAEDAGLINIIGDWVIDTALRTIAEWILIWPQAKKIKYAINISAKQLENIYFIPRLTELIEHYSFPAENLELELTETVLMKDVIKSYKLLTELKALNLTISVDDFGTGYSSLNYLKKLPIDRIKIDRSFIQDIPHNLNDVKITHAIIRLAQTLDLSIIAEGVETEDQEDFLANAGCDSVQGFRYSLPLSTDKFLEFITGQS